MLFTTPVNRTDPDTAEQRVINQSAQLIQPFVTAVSHTANAMPAKFKINNMVYGRQTVIIQFHSVSNNKTS